MTRVLVVDDQTVVRDGLVLLLGLLPEIEVVGSAANGEEALRLVAEHESVAIGLPDTVWFPADGLAALPEDELSFLLFEVEHPEFFDAVLLDDADRVLEIRVKRGDAGTRWIWGAFKMPARVFGELHRLWLSRSPRDEYIGTLVNAWLAAGGKARGCRRGLEYVDVGTLSGYHAAMKLLDERHDAAASMPLRGAAAPSLAETRP